VENTPRVTRARLFGWTEWSRAEWRSLLAALAISLLVHALVLGTAPPVREGDGRRPVLTVTLTGAFIAPRAPVVTAPEAAPATPSSTKAPELPPAPMFTRPAATAPAARSARVAVAPETRSQEDAVRPPARAIAPPGLDERGFLPADALEQPPNPLSSPELGDVPRRVVGRRLQTRLWIDADGSVRQAMVKRNEIPEEIAVLLEHALATVRFSPGQQGGHAVASVLDARLCFDDAGVLDTNSSECLKPAAAPADAAASSPR
jgi:hypothetical protein